MGVRKITKVYFVVAIGLIVLVSKQFSSNHNEYDNEYDPVDPRYLSSKDTISNDLYAVINTPKMGTGGLVATGVTNECRKAGVSEGELLQFDCPDGHTVLRTHNIDIGSTAVQSYRKDNPEGQCLIVTAIRDPAYWLPSMFLQSLGANLFEESSGGCNLDEWPSKETLLYDFRKYVQNNFDLAFSVIPALLNEFGGGGLNEQFKIMDTNGGYSLLGPAPPQSMVAGCKLLFLRMEQSDSWPAILADVAPTVQFVHGISREEQCPNLTEHFRALTDNVMTSAEKFSIYQGGNEYVREWLDAYGYLNASKRQSKDIYAVINTGKMGTGGLTSTALYRGCAGAESNVKELSIRTCPDGQTVFRTHKFMIGSKAIQEHRENNPEGQCLIVTAIRDPRSWFPSKFLQSLGAAKFVESSGGCNIDEWPSKEALVSEFREYVHNSFNPALSSAIPGLLGEFGGGGLKEQFKIMDKNGGYSLLGPAPPQSPVAGCNLLFLRMEQSNQWPDIFRQIAPELQFAKGLARKDDCPILSEHIKAVTDYEMTTEEKYSIYEKGDDFAVEWLDAYGYMNEDPLKVPSIA